MSDISNYIASVATPAIGDDPMATQYAPPPLTFTPPRQPNVTVAYIAGPSLAAAHAATSALPDGEADKTLDDIALKAALAELNQAAADLLSPGMARHFYEWLEAAAYFNASCYIDEECNARCTASSNARDKIDNEPARNVHDQAIKAYLEQLELNDAPPCGPRDFNPIQYSMNGLLQTVAEGSPLPDLLDAMAKIAWGTLPDPSYAWSMDLSLTVMRSANDARQAYTNRKQLSKPAAWREAYERYMRLQGKADALSDDHTGADVADARAGEALDRLIGTVEAPDKAALLTKVELTLKRCADYTVPDTYRERILSDIARLGAELDVAA